MSVNICIKSILANLPEQAKRSVLYGIVGSLNARIIGAAARIVQQIERRDGDVSSEICNEFACTAEAASFASESGHTHDQWLDLLNLASMRDDYQQVLALEVNDKDVLPFSDTMKFMTSGEVRRQNIDELKALAEALDCGITAEDLQRLSAFDQVEQRAKLAAKSHDIMSIVMALPFTDSDVEHEAFDKLSEQAQLSITHKLVDSLNKARDNALLAVMRRSRGASLSDIPLINAALKEVDVILRNAEGGLPAEREEAIKAEVIAKHEEHKAEAAKAAAPAKPPRKLSRPKTGETSTTA